MPIVSMAFSSRCLRLAPLSLLLLEFARTCSGELRIQRTKAATLKTITNFSDPSLAWVNKPSSYVIDLDKNTLAMNPPPHGDLWMRTYYPWARHERHFNASALVAEVPFWQNATLELEFSLTPVMYYDQAGAVVLLDENTWVKAGIENFAVGGPHLSVVVTNQGFSDWSTQKLPWDKPRAGDDSREVSLKIRITKVINNIVQGPALYIESWDAAEGRWDLVRLLPVDSGPASKNWLMGPFACAPTLPAHNMKVIFTKMLLGAEISPCVQC